jgi:hypothetical protein
MVEFGPAGFSGTVVFDHGRFLSTVFLNRSFLTFGRGSVLKGSGWCFFWLAMEAQPVALRHPASLGRTIPFAGAKWNWRGGSADNAHRNDFDAFRSL